MFPTSFYTRLYQLTAVQQTAFILALTQRAAPNYLLFNQHTHFDDGQLFMKAVQLLWQSLSPDASKINFELQQDKFEVIIPRVEDFDFYGVHPALDSCVLMSSAFYSIISPTPEEAENASHTSLSTVIQFIELQAEDELSEQALKRHELLINELEFQQEILNFIESNKLNKMTLKQLYTMAKNNDFSNLGISLLG